MSDADESSTDWRLVAAVIGVLAIALLPLLDLPASTALTIILVVASLIFAVSLVLSTIDRRRSGEAGAIQGVREAGEEAEESEARLGPLPDPIEHGFDMAT